MLRVTGFIGRSGLAGVIVNSSVVSAWIWRDLALHGGWIDAHVGAGEDCLVLGGDGVLNFSATMTFDDFRNVYLRLRIHNVRSEVDEPLLIADNC